MHKKSVVACLLISRSAGEPLRAVRTFGTMTEDLLALADWLAEAGCTHVAMESTGVYWKPIWNLLEDAFALLLVNPRDIKAVPGRKTDVTDAEWIADLLRHGLLRGSYVPDRPQRELRELTRYRTSLVRERTAEANRLQKTLEGANIKLASVATDILGTSGRAMLQALVAGATDAAALAHLARGRLREKLPELERALTGRVHAPPTLHGRRAVGPHRLPGGSHRPGERGDRRAAAPVRRGGGAPGHDPRHRPVPGRSAHRRDRHGHEPVPEPGATWRVGRGCARATTKARASDAAGRTRKGSPWLRALLVQAAHAGARKKDTYLGAQYRRLAARRGKSRAAVAVGHTILVIAYHLLRDGTDYHDLGPRYFDERDRRAVERRLVHRLEGLGYTVSLQPQPRQPQEKAIFRPRCTHWPPPRTTGQIYPLRHAAHYGAACVS